MNCHSEARKMILEKKGTISTDMKKPGDMLRAFVASIL